MLQSKTVLSLTMDLLAHNAFNHLRDDEISALHHLILKLTEPLTHSAEPAAHFLEPCLHNRLTGTIASPLQQHFDAAWKKPDGDDGSGDGDVLIYFNLLRLRAALQMLKSQYKSLICEDLSIEH